MDQPYEVEVKIATPSAAVIRKKLRDAGFAIRSSRQFEHNVVLDDARSRLRKSGLLLRLRLAGRKILCTYKGPAHPGLHKRRIEQEFYADSLPACLAVFEGLGFSPRFRYEKYRTEFARAGEPGYATLDETPVGIFMELEGPARWIDATAKALGFSRADYITASYADLYFAWCKEHGIKPTHMTFEQA